MQLVNPDDPILRTPCRPDFSIQMRDVAQMFSILQEKQALGLAAPQVGINARLFITYWGEIFVNPQIAHAEHSTLTNEGCLSLPGVVVPVRRYRKIWLSDGRTFENYQAAVIQHECDHLNGILITANADSVLCAE